MPKGYRFLSFSEEQRRNPGRPWERIERMRRAMVAMELFRKEWVAAGYDDFRGPRDIERALALCAPRSGALRPTSPRLLRAWETASKRCREVQATARMMLPPTRAPQPTARRKELA